MANTFNDLNGSQGTGTDSAEFAFDFPSIAETDVKVEVDNVVKTLTTHYTIINYTTNGGGKVRFTAGNIPTTSAEKIRIFRETDVDTAKATYTAGSSVKAGDLNDNHEQLLFAAQEEQNQTIQTFEIKDDAVTGAKIKADEIDSQHYAAGSIDLEHMSANSVDSDQYVDGSIDTIHIGDDQVTYAKVQNVSATDRVLGRDSSGAGIIEEIAPAALRTMINVEDGATADQSNAEIRAAVEAASDSNVFTDADHSKLNAIEASATADQTDAEIRAAVEAATDSNVFTDADHTKLNAIEASADVTDATNVAAAGAVMKTTVDAKGDLLVATADNTIAKLTAGTNDHVLTADSGEASGMKWAAVVSSGEANQNAFSNIAVSGQTTVAADSTTDTFTIVGGTNVTVTTDATADSITIAASGGEVTVQDEGSSLSTAATTLNFVGAGVTASGTGATKTITISGGGGAVTTDYQYLELKAHNNASGAFSAGAADYELVTKGTTTAVTPGQAAALLISVAGVLQQPNTGTSIGSNDGFCIDGSSIHFGANLAAHPDFVIWMKASGSHVVADDSVGAPKIDLSIVQGDIIHGTGTNTWTNLAKGTAGQVLKMNSGATAPEWSSSAAGLAGGTDTTYSISCVDGDNTDEEKIRLTAGGSGSGTDDVVLEAGTGLSIARDADKITFTNTVSGIGGATGVDFNDDVKARFGTGNDLEIYHDGSNSFIDDTGTGQLRIRTSDLIVMKADGTESILKGTADGAFSAYYDNSKKFETVTGGVTVTGTCTATSFAGDGSSLTGIASTSLDGCGYQNDQTIAAGTYTIASGKGMHSVGPITNNGTVTVNGRWVIS